jgi:hypothetical protein
MLNIRGGDHASPLLMVDLDTLRNVLFSGDSPVSPDDVPELLALLGKKAAATGNIGGDKEALYAWVEKTRAEVRLVYADFPDRGIEERVP